MSIQLYEKRCFICGKPRREVGITKHSADKRICQRCQLFMKEYRKDKGFGNPLIVHFDNKK